MSLNGLDAVINKLTQLKRNAEALPEQENIPMAELFPPGFLVKNSRFGSWDELVEAAIDAGFKMGSAEEFQDIPEADWDRFIATHTQFSTWETMVKIAVAERIKARLDI